MPCYKYKPYYKYNGPTRTQPLREELSPDQIEERLTYFFEDIANYFDGVEAKFATTAAREIQITTDITKADCDKRVADCLKSLDLYGNKISVSE